MSAIRRIGAGAGKYAYLVLVAACGVLAVVESQRLRRDFESSSFLTGPGGYLMIVGIVLLFFAALEGLSLAAKGRRAVVAQTIVPATEEAVAAAPDDEKRDVEPAGRGLSNKWRMRLSFVCCVIFVLLIEPLGFTLASLAFLAVNLLLLGNGKVSILVTLGVVFLILHFGAPAIGLSLPKGILGL